MHELEYGEYLYFLFMLTFHCVESDTKVLPPGTAQSSSVHYATQLISNELHSCSGRSYGYT